MSNIVHFDELEAAIKTVSYVSHCSLSASHKICPDAANFCHYFPFPEQYFSFRLNFCFKCCLKKHLNLVCNRILYRWLTGFWVQQRNF